MKPYLIGIDTGGTFTDGVLVEYEDRRVVSSAKSLTTRKDLKLGVIKVLQKLIIPEDARVSMVGLSSTLATNSIAEGKARKTALLLIGYNPALIENYKLKEAFATADMTFISGGHDARGNPLNPLDTNAVKNWAREKKDQVDALAVSAYFSPMDPSHENQAYDIIRQETSLPVVLGHQLSSHLNSIKRAATASVNASLVPVMHHFLKSIHRALTQLDIQAPIMIVRGDGTLMPWEEAMHKPVETVMSGPAASAIGGSFLSGMNSSLVIDMGSTTTDIALVENGKIFTSETGAKIENIHTAIEAARIRTVSLGCDSRIQINQKNEAVTGPQRVRALSQLARHYPKVKETIQHLTQDNYHRLKSPHDLEFWHWYQPISTHTQEQLTKKQKEILELLREPVQLSALMKERGVYHPQQLDMHPLIQQGYIECSGVNPTDLLHMSQDIELWDIPTAEMATRCLAKLCQIKPKELINNVFESITHRLTEEALLYLAGRETPDQDMPQRIDGKWGKWLLNELLYANSSLLSLKISGKVPITGTGAPAAHFLKTVSRLLNTKLILPQYHEVANALGAVSGSLAETREALVFIREDQEHFSHVVKWEDHHTAFDSYEQACRFARQKAFQMAKEAAIHAGASDPYTQMTRKNEGSMTRFVARSSGSPKISENN